MGAFEDAVKKKEAELAAKKTDASDRLNVLEETNPTYRLGQEVPVSRTITLRREPSAKPETRKFTHLSPFVPLKEYATRVEALKEEERAKAMKKAASMKGK